MTDEKMREAAAKLARALMEKRGQVVTIDIAHEPWCPELKGGECRCDPDIYVNGRKESDE